jgi:hypothetical protein
VSLKLTTKKLKILIENTITIVIGFALNQRDASKAFNEMPNIIKKTFLEARNDGFPPEYGREFTVGSKSNDKICSADGLIGIQKYTDILECAGASQHDIDDTIQIIVDMIENGILQEDGCPEEALALREFKKQIKAIITSKSMRSQIDNTRIN